MMDIKVGDKFIWVSGSRYRADQNVTITRVGRKYAYVAVDGGTELREKFDRTTGFEVVSYGSATHLTTASLMAEEAACADLVRELRVAGVDLRLRLGRTLDYQTLAAMLELVKIKPNG